MTMKFIEEHQLLPNQVFENEIPEDLDLSNHSIELVRYSFSLDSERVENNSGKQ